MHLRKACLMAVVMALGAMAAPQVQQQQQPINGQQPVAAASTQSQTVAQSRDAPVYADAGGYSQGGYAAPAAQGGYQAAASSAYGAPSSNYGVPAAAGSGGYGGAAQQAGGAGNQGYYYYYYPVQEQKEAASHYAPKETYAATDSYGIDPLGIIGVLAVAGLVIAGLALLFPGWAYVRSDESVYYRSMDGSANTSFLGLNKEDYKTLTSLVLSAIEGEDCIDKLMCDAGKLVKKVKQADAFLRVMEELAPTSVAGTIKKLRTSMKKGDECKKAACSKKNKSS